MNPFLAVALSLNTLDPAWVEDSTPSAPSEIIFNESRSEFLSFLERAPDWLQMEVDSSSFVQALDSLLETIKDPHQQEIFDSPAMEDLLPGDFLLFGLSEKKIQATGIYLGDNQFIQVISQNNTSHLYLHELSDPEWETSGPFPYRRALRVQQKGEGSSFDKEIASPDNSSIQETPLTLSSFAFLSEQFDYYFVNQEQLPFVISPKKDQPLSLASFQTWASAHQEEFTSLLATNGALLLRGFPLESAENFASIIPSVLGRPLMDYRGGEGSRKKVAEGVYTSTEAPPQFHIPLHHELSCSNHPPDYICFYCDIAPAAGSGQTILGKTQEITQAMLHNPKIWSFFNGQKIKYISRHPPAGSFFSKVNKTHKSWPEAFETNDPQEVERICHAKGLEYTWLGDWIEVVRKVPAIQGPDKYFDHPYWFNQLHLYHANPRIRGGWINHLLANLLYVAPKTGQYDVELEYGTQIPKDIVYGIYDILEQKTIKFDWEKGDALIVDNRRALHGRAPYSGQRRILVSMVP